MTLLENLQEEYSVIVCQDIGDFFSMSWGDFYLHLKSLKREEYRDDERLVFYLRDTVSDDLLERFFKDFFQQLKVVDVPNFFIVLVLPGDREHDIATRCYQAVGVDSPPTVLIDEQTDGNHHQPTEITESRAAFGMPATVCPLPWNSLDISPIGTFAPCCFYQGGATRDNGTLFDPTVDSLEEVYNSNYMKKLRRLFREGVRLQACSRCWKEEESGAVSKRQLYALRFGDDSRSINWEEDDLKNLKMVSVAFGNVCNFKCRICSEKSSSKIAGEILAPLSTKEKKTHRAWQAIEKGKWIHDGQTLWDSVIDNPQIKYFDFAGGEPLLDKNHLRALESMVERNIAGDVSIHYNTNGSIINDHLLDLWRHFKKIDLAISIDDIGDRFDIQRPGGEKFGWSTVEQNVRYIKEHKTNNVILNIHCVVSVMNVHYLPELCDWIESAGFEDLYFSILYNPDHLSLSKIPKKAAELSIEKLKSHSFNERTRPFIETVLGILEKSKHTENIPFVNYMNQLDSVRGESFAKAHPEVAKALGLV
jgi:MoaA/NifB/PqqE/SkfB family radical SAM enzyme